MANKMRDMYPFLFTGEQMFWYLFLVHVLVMFGICTYVYGCKYLNELCYKAPISGMCHVIMMLYSLCCHVGLLLSRMIIVNTATI